MHDELTAVIDAARAPRATWRTSECGRAMDRARTVGGVDPATQVLDHPGMRATHVMWAVVLPSVAACGSAAPPNKPVTVTTHLLGQAPPPRATPAKFTSQWIVDRTKECWRYVGSVRVSQLLKVCDGDEKSCSAVEQRQPVDELFLGTVANIGGDAAVMTDMSGSHRETKMWGTGEACSTTSDGKCIGYTNEYETQTTISRFVAGTAYRLVDDAKLQESQRPECERQRQLLRRFK